MYLNFPVCMIPPIYKDKDVVNALNNIIKYGIAIFINRNNVSKKEAGEYLGININSSLDELEKVYKKFNSKVMTSIDKDTAFTIRDARKNYKDNRDEIIAICGELAIRSIVGVKDYAKCFRGIVLSRMAGFEKGVQEDWYPEAIKKLAGDGGKRQWRKLISSLKYAGCSIYAPNGCRGFYASFRLSPLELAEKVERKMLEAKQRRTEYDLSSDELRKMALEKISRTP